jgi:tryptophan 7-halogenase
MDKLAPVVAEAFRLNREGDDVLIDFGRLDGVPVPAGLVSIHITDRVTLPLERARRLLLWLDEAVAPHAARMRAEQIKGMAPAAAAAATRPDHLPQRPRVDPSGERAAQLLQAVGAWKVPHQFERSLRMTQGSLQANRFLLTVNTKDIPGDPAVSALAICDQFMMPASLCSVASDNFGMAKCVHFGFEGEPDSIVCKLYLEGDVSVDEARRARGAGEPVLMHLAFKWDLVKGGGVTSRYMWYPYLSAPEIGQRLDRIYRDGTGASAVIARAVLQAAAERSPTERLQYLEVEEPETSRRSFDLNLYNAKMQVRDIQGLLLRMREQYSVRPGQFQALYDQINGMVLGHLAGGIHRDGRDFFNVYYGAVGLPRFNERLQ